MSNVTLPDTRHDDALAHAPPGFLGWVGELVRRHRAELLAFARRRGLSGDDALDVVQDAFVTFLGLPEARSIADVPADAIKMLVVLVRHGASNRRRKVSRRARLDLVRAEPIAASTESSEELLARAEELARARGCILRMVELQRRVVTLAILDELPHERVAERLGITAGHARVLLHRAREHVRTCPDMYGEES